MKYLIIEWDEKIWKSVDTLEEVKDYFKKVAEGFHPKDMDYFENFLNEVSVVDIESGVNLAFEVEPIETLRVEVNI